MKFRLSNECKKLIHDKWGNYGAVAQVICEDLLPMQKGMELQITCTIGIFVGIFNGVGPKEIIESFENLKF